MQKESCKKFRTISTTVFWFLGLFIASHSTLGYSQSVLVRKNMLGMYVSSFGNIGYLIEAVELPLNRKGIIVNLERAPDLCNIPFPKELEKEIHIGNDTEIYNFLNLICNNPLYAWSRSGNIINIFPRKIINDENYIFNAVVDKINIQNASWEGVLDEIDHQLEKKFPGKYRHTDFKGRERFDLSRSVWISSQTDPKSNSMSRHGKFSINLSHSTVREILNALSHQEKEGWFAMQMGNGPAYANQMTFMQVEDNGFYEIGDDRKKR